MRRLITCMVMMCFWLTTEAQAIFDLTASQVKIDSLLPVFTWQKPLGPHYADSVYTVSIVYPEFINMSEADIRRYQEISGVPLPGQKANPRAMPTIPYFVKALGQRSVCQQRVSINFPTS